MVPVASLGWNAFRRHRFIPGKFSSITDDGGVTRAGQVAESSQSDAIHYPMHPIDGIHVMVGGRLTEFICPNTGRVSTRFTRLQRTRPRRETPSQARCI